MVKQLLFASPEAAEFAFYKAFEEGDLNAMIGIWEDSEAIVCIHPLGPRFQGLSQIQESWRQIFASGTRLGFRITHAHCFEQQDLAVRIVYENITVLNAGSDEQPTQPVIATNIYRRSQDGWRMIVHHASPGPAVSASRERTSERIH